MKVLKAMKVMKFMRVMKVMKVMNRTYIYIYMPFHYLAQECKCVNEIELRFWNKYVSKFVIQKSVNNLEARINIVDKS